MSRRRGSACTEYGAQLGWVALPAANPFIQATIEGMQRMLARPTQKKELITSDTLAKLVKDTNRNSTLANIHLVTAFLIAYAGFLRLDELVQLRSCDIKINALMAKLHI